MYSSVWPASLNHRGLILAEFNLAILHQTTKSPNSNFPTIRYHKWLLIGRDHWSRCNLDWYLHLCEWLQWIIHIRMTHCLLIRMYMSCSCPLTTHLICVIRQLLEWVHSHSDFTNIGLWTGKVFSQSFYTLYIQVINYTRTIIQGVEYRYYFQWGSGALSKTTTCIANFFEGGGKLASWEWGIEIGGSTYIDLVTAVSLPEVLQDYPIIQVREGRQIVCWCWIR